MADRSAVTAAPTIGPVHLTMPADPSLSRVARLAASGVASLSGFTIDEIEDIKVAVSEVMVALIEHGARQPLTVTFQADGPRFTVRGTTAIDHFDTEHPDLLLCRTVLAAVCASHGIDVVDSGAEIWATIEQSPR